ncbi:hypothetical protein ACLQ29_33355 [Micromonospora sp. DT228]|uniref:hypothetical protein n=1 Tax=Micromonospora sp. DT228 TaxID=3393443 RepID=UPI003CE7699E
MLHRSRAGETAVSEEEQHIFRQRSLCDLRLLGGRRCLLQAAMTAPFPPPTPVTGSYVTRR